MSPPRTPGNCHDLMRCTSRACAAEALAEQLMQGQRGCVRGRAHPEPTRGPARIAEIWIRIRDFTPRIRVPPSPPAPRRRDRGRQVSRATSAREPAESREASPPHDRAPPRDQAPRALPPRLARDRQDRRERAGRACCSPGIFASSASTARQAPRPRRAAALREAPHGCGLAAVVDPLSGPRRPLHRGRAHRRHRSSSRARRSHRASLAPPRSPALSRKSDACHDGGAPASPKDAAVSTRRAYAAGITTTSALFTQRRCRRALAFGPLLLLRRPSLALYSSTVRLIVHRAELRPAHRGSRTPLVLKSPRAASVGIACCVSGSGAGSGLLLPESRGGGRG
jgi:hypothetical protein